MIDAQKGAPSIAYHSWNQPVIKAWDAKGEAKDGNIHILVAQPCTPLDMSTTLLVAARSKPLA